MNMNFQRAMTELGGGDFTCSRRVCGYQRRTWEGQCRRCSHWDTLEPTPASAKNLVDMAQSPDE